MRAFRFVLDPNAAALEMMERYAGAARWAFNHGHAYLLAQHRAFDARVREHAQQLSGLSAEDLTTTLTKVERTRLFTQARRAIQAENTERCTQLKVIDEHRKRVVHKGKPALDPGELEHAASPLARKLHARRIELAAWQVADPEEYVRLKAQELEEVRPHVLELKKELTAQGAYRPNFMDLKALWRTTRDLPKDQGGSPWHKEVNSYALSCGFERADAAWKNWMDSASGKRAGRRVGMPRFKRKGRARDSFVLCHDVKRPSICLEDPRHLTLPGIGTVRMQAHGRRLWRLLRRSQAVISSVTVSRGAHRWYASVLYRVQQDVPDRPNKRQRANGMLAVDLGSQPLAVLSAPLNIADPDSRYIAAAKHGLHATRGGTDRVAKIHHMTAEHRASHLHGVSKRLSTEAAIIAVKGFDLTELTATARGTIDAPGTDVKVKSQFNRSLLDAGLGELRSQLAYKTRWYGSALVVLDKGEPTSTKCAKCDARNPTVTPGHKHFTCPSCGHDANRRHNAAASIHKAARRELASVAPGRGDTKNSRGGGESPDAGNGTDSSPMKRPPPA
ncbi:RNA-guided endonuclease TnpB family protein [Streptomyces sp. NPDC057743]|uniref:RNA-guided endonuclease TnpB family protein n=1 Tax=Streptomyces sp. NPDC057743 TaxID=3346236 RepID=UPI0036C71A5C